MRLGASPAEEEEQRPGKSEPIEERLIRQLKQDTETCTCPV